jgi:hypothetical protein
MSCNVDFWATQDLMKLFNLVENHRGEFHALRICSGGASSTSHHIVGHLKSDSTQIIYVEPQSNRPMSNTVCLVEPIILNGTLMGLTNANTTEHLLSFTVEKPTTGAVIGWCFDTQNVVKYLSLKEVSEFVGENPWSREVYDKIAEVAFREPQKKERLPPIQIGGTLLNNRSMNDAAQVWLGKYGANLVTITMHKQHRDDSEAKCRKYVIHDNGKKPCTSLKRCVDFVMQATGQNFYDDLKKNPTAFINDIAGKRAKRDTGGGGSSRRHNDGGPSTVVEVSGLVLNS